MFNPFLRELKSDFVGTRYAAFWSHVTSEGVTLVSSVECGVSDVTPEQAKQVSPVMTHSYVTQWIVQSSLANSHTVSNSHVTCQLSLI